MSTDVERRPTRFDSQVTRVEGGEEDCSTEKLPRFSIDGSGSPDNPYNPAPRRHSRHPNLKGPSPLPGAQTGFQDQYGEVPWRCGNPHRFSTPKNGDSWHKCWKLTEKHDNEMCDAWKDEVDKLLIFAGLFSATVTAFAVESYKWLQEDNEDVSVRLLAFMASQVAQSNVSVPPELVPPPFSVSGSDIRINAAWFLSLTLSLTTVLIGILCLQWLREFQRDAALPHKEAVALRQMRYEGLLHWRVPEILSALPVLLQAALILFFVGLLDLLWNRHQLVAILISTVVGVVMSFLAATTMLPALQHAFTKVKHLQVKQCAYKSPQSWLFYRTGHVIFWLFNSFNLPWSKFDSHRFHRLLKSAGDLNWMAFDMRWRQLRDAEEVVRGTAKKLRDSDDIIHALQWINNTFAQSVEAVYPIYHGLADLDVSTAATTISGFYLDGQIDNATLRVMLDDRFSPTEEQKRDILSAYYLHLHQGTHIVLKASYFETIIRILNSQEVPRPFYDWLSEILQELASALPSSTDSSSSFSLLDPEITVQVLICIKKLIPRNVLQTLDAVVAWALLHRLLSPSLITSSDPDHPAAVEVNVSHLKLAGGLFEQFEYWIHRGREIDRWERVKLCAEGMMTLFPPSSGADIPWLESLCPEAMAKAGSLVRVLNARIDVLGGPKAVLLRERWWLDYWEAYTESDWERLLLNFQVLGSPEEL
ncbi:unnamed protein product [Cyclocybe aegerita]|uniref:DUF6535 domain-containing protein n=1 Tax=Cyclocybe aegerita TaxID=1973307 RepID=A0A8S0XD13_CYCAE|nr:unnamed protein product [Cyclocybe aegerita]